LSKSAPCCETRSRLRLLTASFVEKFRAVVARTAASVLSVKPWFGWHQIDEAAPVGAARLCDCWWCFNLEGSDMASASSASIFHDKLYTLDAALDAQRMYPAFASLAQERLDGAISVASFAISSTPSIRSRGSSESGG
jgi:hypothetical protein